LLQRTQIVVIYSEIAYMWYWLCSLVGLYIVKLNWKAISCR